MSAVLDGLGAALALAGALILTIGVYGLLRLPDLHTQVHATSKTVVLGVVVVLLGSTATGDAAIMARSALVALLLLLTTPVAAHALARAVYQRGDSLGGPREGDALEP